MTVVSQPRRKPTYNGAKFGCVKKRVRATLEQSKLDELIESFIHGEAASSMESGIDSDEEFWDNLDLAGTASRETHVQQSVSSKPDPGWNRATIHSRLSR